MTLNFSSGTKGTRKSGVRKNKPRNLRFSRPPKKVLREKKLMKEYRKNTNDQLFVGQLPPHLTQKLLDLIKEECRCSLSNGGLGKPSPTKIELEELLVKVVNTVFLPDDDSGGHMHLTGPGAQPAFDVNYPLHPDRCIKLGSNNYLRYGVVATSKNKAHWIRVSLVFKYDPDTNADTYPRPEPRPEAAVIRYIGPQRFQLSPGTIDGTLAAGSPGFVQATENVAGYNPDWQ